MSANKPIQPYTAFSIKPELCTNLDNGNNTFEFIFSQNIVTTDTTRMTISQLSIPYSWYNITAAFGNNQFQYRFVDKAGVEHKHTVTIPNGHYDTTTLNAFLQYSMIKNGHYLVDQFGNYKYYLEFVWNLAYYRTQVNAYVLPNALPAGWTNPAGVISFVGAGAFTSFQLILTDTGRTNGGSGSGAGQRSLFVFFGFYELGQTSPPTYPISRSIPVNGTLVDTSTLGELTPEVRIAHSVSITCNYVQNPLRTSKNFAENTFVIASSDINVPYGEKISNDQFFNLWIPIVANQSIAQMRFTITDQDGELLLLQDPDVQVQFTLTDLRY